VLFRSNIGAAHFALHHYAEAARALDEFLRGATIQGDRRTQVEQWLQECQQFVARLTFTGLPNGAVVRIDGTQVGTAPLPGAIAVSTGQHVVEVFADGYRDYRDTLIIGGGQAREIAPGMRPVAVAAPVQTVQTGQIVVRSTPNNAAVTVDNAAHTAGLPVTVAPGSHALRVSAPGFREWRGDVPVAAGASRVVTVQLPPTGRLSPVVFGATAGVTVAAGIATVIFGGLTLSTLGRFERLTSDDPQAPGVAAEGETQRTLTNVFLGLTLGGVAASVVVLTRTNFGPRQPTVDVALVPRLDGGAMGAFAARF
jgi:hypothetical protein